MNNFEFYNPVRICFGKGELTKLTTLIPKGRKILLTYGGGSIKKNRVYDQVMDALKGIDVIEFSGIEPNPRYETLMKAVEIVRNEKVDFLLAVGGGSVLDGTKFIAAASLWEGDDPWEIVSRRNEVIVKNVIPIGAVLTLPATGSEMNGNAVITKWETREKLGFYSDLVKPLFSILDPEVVFSLPDIQVSNGIVDAFIHVMEQYLTYPVNSPIQDRFAESILLTLIEEGPKVLANRKDYDSAANFMWAATMALNELIGKGVPQDWATHMIGHEITALHGVDHGQTLAIVLPGVMKVKRENKKEKILQYAKRVWNISAGTEDERIEKAIRKTVDFFESLGIRTKLSDYNLGKETIADVVDRFRKRGMVGIGEKRDVTPGEIARILETQL